MARFNYPRLRAYRKNLGLPWFTAAWDLNLIVGRSGRVGRWDDFAFFAFVDDAGRELVEQYVVSADAWEGEWLDPSHPDGCVYILDGHYPGGYAPGEHKGRPCLRQQKPFRYVRWPKAEQRVPTVAQLRVRAEEHAFEAIRGTHLHNIPGEKPGQKPGQNLSEGCVITCYQHQHAGLMRLVETQRQVVGSATVSPTFAPLSDL